MTGNLNLGGGADGGFHMQRGPDGRFLPRRTNAEPLKGLMRQCNSLLRTLMKHKYGYVFNEPVDPIELGIPDYFKIITSPMDLGTVKENLQGNVYSNPLEFASDVRLTFANALEYNPPGDMVHKMAKTLSRDFEGKWKAIEKKMYSNQRSELNPSEKRLKVKISDRPKQPKQKLLSAFRAQPEHEPKPGIRKPPVTFEVLQNIVKKFEEWTEDIPEQIVGFVKRHNTCSVQSADEILLDFNTLDNEALWELQGLVTSYLKTQDQGDVSAQPNEETCGAELALFGNESRLHSGSPKRPQKGEDLSNDDVEMSDLNVPNISSLEIEDIYGSRSKGVSSSSYSYSSSRGTDSDSDSRRTLSTGSDAYKA